MALGIQVLSSLTANQVIFDFTATAESLRFSTNRHGFADCSLTVPLSQADAFRLYDLAGAVFLRVSDNGLTAWEGRVEDVRVINGGAALKALGCWRALYDVPYTALWSSSRMDAWRPATTADVVGRNDKLFLFENNTRLQISLKKNATYTSGADLGSLALELPDDSDRVILKMSGSYSYSLPANFTFRTRTADNSFTDVATNNITTSGGVGSGTLSWTPGTTADGYKACIEVYNTTGSSYSNTAEDGAYYVRFTGVRVWTVSASAVYASDVAGGLVTFVNGVNSGQLSSTTGLVSATDIDLTDEVYEDQAPADILDRLAFIGDTSGSPYEVGVWESQQLHFRQRGQHGRTWYIDVSSLDVERSAGDAWNSVYAVYQETSGRNLRTSTNSSSESAARFGMTRRAAVNLNTTSSTQAAYARDVYLADNKDGRPRVSLAIEALYDATGAEHPVWTARSGDTIVIRNLPPTVSQQIDKITSFRLDETEYDARSNSNRLVPESPPPALDVLVARQGVGL